MRVLVVYAHPLETSFNAALHAHVLAILHTRGHEVDDCDLYAESFDPLLNRQDLVEYNDISANRRRVVSYVDRLATASSILTHSLSVSILLLDKANYGCCLAWGI